MKWYAATHVDDFIVFSPSWELHLEHISDVLERLREASLTVKLKKCQFAMKSIKILGQMIEDGFLKLYPNENNSDFKLS